MDGGGNSSPENPRFISQTISFGDKRFGYGFSTETDNDPEEAMPSIGGSFEGITGKKVLLSLLSLMCRSFDSTVYEAFFGRKLDTGGRPSAPQKPNLAAPYAVEIGTQTFDALHSILVSQMDTLFEKCSDGNACSGLNVSLGVDKYVDEMRQLCGPLDVDVNGSLSIGSGPVVPFAGDLVTWGILRCALNCLQQNLFALNAVSLAESSSALYNHQASPYDDATALNVTAATGAAAEGVFQSSHLSPVDRLVGILNGTIEDRGVRSSDEDEDEEDDDDDDEEDAREDDDTDEDEDDEEDEEDYEQSRDHLLDDMQRDDDDLYDEFEGDKILYEDEDDTREDLLAMQIEGDDQSGFGRISVGDISRGTRSVAGDREGNNDSSINSRDTSRGGARFDATAARGEMEINEEDFAGLVISSTASEEGSRSPALSHESMDFAANRTSEDMFDANNEDTVDVEREQTEAYSIECRGEAMVTLRLLCVVLLHTCILY